MVRKMKLNCNTLVQYMLLGQSHISQHYLGYYTTLPKFISDVYLINACNLMFILCKLKFRE